MPYNLEFIKIIHKNFLHKKVIIQIGDVIFGDNDPNVLYEIEDYFGAIPQAIQGTGTDRVFLSISIDPSFFIEKSIDAINSSKGLSLLFAKNSTDFWDNLTPVAKSYFGSYTKLLKEELHAFAKFVVHVIHLTLEESVDYTTVYKNNTLISVS